MAAPVASSAASAGFAVRRSRISCSLARRPRSHCRQDPRRHCPPFCRHLLLLVTTTVAVASSPAHDPRRRRRAGREEGPAAPAGRRRGGASGEERRRRWGGEEKRHHVGARPHTPHGPGEGHRRPCRLRGWRAQSERGEGRRRLASLLSRHRVASVRDLGRRWEP
jgi:hypothetical protein